MNKTSSPIHHLNKMMVKFARSNPSSPAWRGYFEPLDSLSQGLPAPLLGIMVLIWQLREHDLQLHFPLDTTSSRLDFLAWCVVHGRLEYASLREASSFWTALAQPAFSSNELPAGDAGHAFSRLMLLIHRARPDVTADLTCPDDRARFLNWFVQHGMNELNLPNGGLEDWQKAYLGRPLQAADLSGREALVYTSGANLQQALPSPEALHELPARSADEASNKEPGPLLVQAGQGGFDAGANVIGYAFGELGIGEDARMAARALQAASVPVVMLNFEPGSGVSQKDTSCQDLIAVRPAYKINLFCLTAPEHARCFAIWGSALLEGRFNIGYWPWELSKWPTEWEHLNSLADEIWVSSDFIGQSIRACKSWKPNVRTMPMAVEVPKASQKTRKDFGLPATSKLFLFIFDLNSSIHRKNPQACLSAFLSAFPAHADNAVDDVGIVIKTNRPAQESDEWKKLKAAERADARIHLIEDTLPKADLLALYNVCDVFVSLHRSEGFGRCIAEAMLLAKPVITTGYSGNMDFTTPANALLVSFELKPVKKGQYLQHSSQLWAEPSIVHAAQQMQYAIGHDSLLQRVNAQNTIRDTYGFEAVGANYRHRLQACAPGLFPFLNTSSSNHMPPIQVKVGHNSSVLLNFLADPEGKRCTISPTSVTTGKIWALSKENLAQLSSCAAFKIDVPAALLPEALWLAYHVAALGASIESAIAFPSAYLGRDSYYDGKVSVVTPHKIVVTNASTRPSEGISFCIPTGGDTEELRLCVERILKLPIEKKEIILCGSVSSTFPYLSSVRIVGEDIPHPPIWITRKKNVAVHHATYENVCVLHDRVLLPSNFGEILDTSLPLPVMGIGGLFTLSSDFEQVGRYSDFNVRVQNANQPCFSFLSELSPGTVGEFSLSSELLMSRAAAFHYYTNSRMEIGDKYVTGSFYLTTKHIHQRIPLNEKLFWEDFEDVEWGIRCSRLGVPHVFNSDYYQLTLAIRAMILPPHYYLNEDGTMEPVSPPWWPGLKHGRKHPDRAKFALIKKLRRNFEDFVAKSFLNKNYLSEFDTAANTKDQTKVLTVLLRAIEHTTRNVNSFDTDRIKNIERLISATLERTDMGDMKCHATYFSSHFNLWDRIKSNYGFVRWVGFLKTPGMLIFDDGFDNPDWATKEEIFNAISRNCSYMNRIFGKTESPEYWFNVVMKLVGE